MSASSRRARNHPYRAIDDSIDDRRTPRVIFDQIHRHFAFTVDVAASDANRLLDRYYTRHTDGLLRSWRGERAWCNPPYSRPAPWVSKAWAEMRGGCELVVMLLPNDRAEQPWWQQDVEPYRDRHLHDGIRLTTRFLPGRPRFGFPVRNINRSKRPPFGVVLLVWERGSLSLSLSRCRRSTDERVENWRMKHLGKRDSRVKRENRKRVSRRNEAEMKRKRGGNEAEMTRFHAPDACNDSPRVCNGSAEARNRSAKVCNSEVRCG